MGSDSRSQFNLRQSEWYQYEQVNKSVKNPMKTSFLLSDKVQPGPTNSKSCKFSIVCFVLFTDDHAGIFSDDF